MERSPKGHRKVTKSLIKGHQKVTKSSLKDIRKVTTENHQKASKNPQKGQ